FALPAGGDLVMMTFSRQAAIDHRLDHFAAQVLVMIGGRHREIAFFIARPVAEVIFAASGIPAALVGVDVVVAGVLVLVEADVVEDEELGLGTEIRRVGYAGVV